MSQPDTPWPPDEPVEKEKGLPTSVDAERFVLGSIMLDSALYFEAAGVLESNDFSLEKHRRIFKRMGELQERGERIDRITVCNELARYGELESVDGLSYLVSLDDGLPQIPHIDAYARIVKEKSVKRTIIFTSQHMINRAMLDEESAKEILAGARETILTLGVDDGSGGPQTPSQVVDELGVSAFLQPPPRGLSTGFVKYDDMTGGLYAGELTVVAARPGVGKTAWALNVAHCAAVTQQKTVMFFSLEMSKKTLLFRLLCATARVDSQRVRQGYTSADERRRLAEALEMLAETNLLIDDTSAATTAGMHARIRRQQARGPVDLVVIDYLQLMSAGKKYENRNQEVTAISRGLKLLTSEINAPVIALSQLNRATESRKGNNRPQLSDIRESGAVEQDADVVAFLFREEMYSRDREDLRGVAELIVAKSRNGPTGTINLVFLHNLTKFENRAEDTGDVDQSDLWSPSDANA